MASLRRHAALARGQLWLAVPASPVTTRHEHNARCTADMQGALQDGIDAVFV